MANISQRHTSWLQAVSRHPRNILSDGKKESLRLMEATRSSRLRTPGYSISSASTPVQAHLERNQEMLMPSEG